MHTNYNYKFFSCINNNRFQAQPGGRHGQDGGDLFEVKQQCAEAHNVSMTDIRRLKMAATTAVEVTENMKVKRFILKNINYVYLIFTFTYA